MKFFRLALKSIYFVICLMMAISCQGKPDKLVDSFELLPSLIYSSDSIDSGDFSIKESSVFYVTDTIDLQGKTMYLPYDVTLVMKGGFIKNGHVVGKHSRLKSKGVVFDKVHISGTWEVPNVSTKMFADLNYDNSLKDVMALTALDIQNKVIIEEGTYQVTAFKNYDTCVDICSNTDVILNGTIRLTPNDYPNYGIVMIKGDHITLRGKGTIVGDKSTHTGADGEWGMGVTIAGGDDITVRDVAISDCWGDCIYATGGASNVTIQNCTLDNGRRQGISVISVKDIVIRDCQITSVGGTSPEYAIDIEPNKNDSIGNVVIERVKTLNCKGGIGAYGKAKDAWIGNCMVFNCSVEGAEKVPMPFDGCDVVRIEKCKITDCSGITAIRCKSVKDVKIIINDIAMEPGLKDVAKKILTRSESDKTITTIDCGSVVIK